MTKSERTQTSLKRKENKPQLNGKIKEKPSLSQAEKTRLAKMSLIR